MKKILLSIMMFALYGVTYADINYQCDQTFDGGMLYYDKGYDFYDTWQNGENRNVYFNSYSVSFINPSYLDQGSKFDWTQKVRDQNFTSFPKSNMRVLETGNTPWRIAQHPEKRTYGTRNSYDFGIKYTINYDYSNNYPDSSDDIYHTECIYYSVAWCGDGVKDLQEQCDPNDPNKIGWGNGGCSNTCEVIDKKEPLTCGTAIRTFGASETSWGNFTFCNAGGTPTPSNPAFPGQGKSVSWTCNDTAGESVSCSASRENGSSSSSSSGGGSSNACYSIGVSNNGLNYDFSCSTNGSQYTLDIRETTGGQNTLLKTFTNQGGSYSFVNGKTYTATCYAGITNTTNENCHREFAPTSSSSSSGGGSSSSGGGSSSSGSGGGSSSGGGSGPSCGNGILEFSKGEQCDPGKGNQWPDWCSSDCKIIDKTYPGGGNLIFKPNKDIAIGNGMSVFDYTTPKNKVTLTNTSTSDVYIDDYLCVYNEGNYINGVKQKCTPNKVGLLYKEGGEFTLNLGVNAFMGNTSGMPGTVSENQFVITLSKFKDMGSFIRSKFNAVVAKGSVSSNNGVHNQGGTTTSDVSDISSKVSGTDQGKNSNAGFESVGDVSSSTKKIENQALIDQMIEDGKKDLTGLNNKNFTSGTKSRITKLPTQRYNGLDNVFVHKGDVVLNTGVSNITGPSRTYVIEDGDFTINKNISAPNTNVLFVVRNGNIIIGKDVTHIDAILFNFDGKILGESSLKQLTINGAMYGDVDDLVSKRAYIKDRGEYIDVGTNINFTSKIFSNPPPLLSKFLGDYLEGDKSAK